MKIKTPVHVKLSPLHDINVLTNDQLQHQYGIDIQENGSVWDPIEYKRFDSIIEWARYASEQDALLTIDTFQKRIHNHFYEDY